MKAEVAGLLRHVEGARGSVEPVRAPDRPARRRRPGARRGPAPDPFFALAGGPGDASTPFFAWLPGLYAGVHATPRHRARRPARHGRVEPAHAAGDARHDGLSAARGRHAARRRGCTTHSPRSMPTRASTRARSRPTTSTTSGRPSATTRSTCTAPPTAGTRAVLPAPAPRPRPRRGARRHDAARRAGPGADGGHAASTPLDLLLARCAADAACHAAFPQARERVVDARRGVREGRHASPTRTPGQTARGRPRHGRALDPQRAPDGCRRGPASAGDPPRLPGPSGTR